MSPFSRKTVLHVTLSALISLTFSACRHDELLDEVADRKNWKYKELQTALVDKDARGVCDPQNPQPARIMTYGYVGSENADENQSQDKNTSFSTDAFIQAEQYLPDCTKFSYKVMGYDYLDLSEHVDSYGNYKATDVYASLGEIGEVDKATCTVRITKPGYYAKIAVVTTMTDLKKQPAHVVTDTLALCGADRPSVKEIYPAENVVSSTVTKLKGTITNGFTADDLCIGKPVRLQVGGVLHTNVKGLGNKRYDFSTGVLAASSINPLQLDCSNERFLFEVRQLKVSVSAQDKLVIGEKRIPAVVGKDCTLQLPEAEPYSREIGFRIKVISNLKYSRNGTDTQGSFVYTDIYCADRN